MNKPFSRVAAFEAGMLMAASTYVTVALGLVVGALIARGLGPDDYGRYAYVLWLSGLLVTIGNHGLCISGIRFISEAFGGNRSADAANVHRLLLRRQWWSTALVALAFVGLFPLMLPSGWEGGYLWLTLAILLSFAAKAQYQFGVSMAKGYGQFGVEAWGNMIMSLLYTAGVAVLMFMGASLQWFVAYFVLISLGHVLLIKRLFGRAGIMVGSDNCDPSLRSRINEHLAWSIVHVGAVILSNKTIETFLLNKLVGSAEVGYFTIASNLTRGGVELVASSLTSMLMPMLGHAFGKGGLAQVNRVLSDSLRYCFFMGIVVAGLGCLWAGPGVILLYGQKFEPVVDILRMMVVVGGVVLVEAAFGAVLTTTDNQKLRATAALMSVTVSVGFAFALVPTMGLWGAVIATSLSKLLVTLFVGYAVVRKLEMRLPWRYLARLSLAGGVAFAVLTPILWFSHALLVQFLVGGMFVPLFIAGTVVLGGWQAKDAGLLISLCEKRPNKLGRLLPHLQRWQARLLAREATA